MGDLFSSLISDFILALVLFSIIIVTVFITKKFSNIWINRKIIHLSVVPAVLCYMYVFNEPYIFFSFAIFFVIFLILPHAKSKELSWFQEKKNYGEVFFCLSFAILAIPCWENWRILGGVSMLFMAVGDSVTGIVRSRFLKNRGKHWSGSIAMLATCLIIGAFFLGYKGIILSLIATLLEYQPWVDDNLTVPLLTAVFGALLPI
jgi:dolichol kinase